MLPFDYAGHFTLPCQKLSGENSPVLTDSASTGHNYPALVVVSPAKVGAQGRGGSTTFRCSAAKDVLWQRCRVKLLVPVSCAIAIYCQLRATTRHVVGPTPA